MRRILLACAALLSITVATGALVAGAADAVDAVPHGQRILGNSVIEPVYDADHAGRIGFIKTPEQAPVRSDEHATAPLYLPVYPVGSRVGALICPHLPAEGCPDHGGAIAGLAQSTFPEVYGAGVLGHDHLMSFRGADYHVVRQPVVVLFTSARAAQEHLLTSDAIAAAIDRGDAVAIPLAGARIHAELTSVRTWQLATPVS